MPLRVASWNIQSCRRGVPGVIAKLRQLEADVVALQEVDRGTLRAGGLDQAATLAREAGYRHFEFFRAVAWDRGDYGLALLSKHPLRDARIDALPGAHGIEPRILGTAIVDHPQGELAVHVTHLSHRFDRRELRHRQARFIARQLTEEPRPRVLLGDFNDLPGSRMHRELTDYFHDVFRAVGEGPGGTHPLGWLLPTVRIDYVFASRELRLERARVLRTDASDHHVLAAELLAPVRALPAKVGLAG